MQQRSSGIGRLVLGLLAIMQLPARDAETCVDSKSRAGRCVALASCPYLIEEFYVQTQFTAYGTDFQTFVSDAICGFDGTNFLICCANRDQTGSRPPRQQPYLPAPTFVTAATQAAPTYQTLFQFASLNAIGMGMGGGAAPVPTYPPVQYPTQPQQYPMTPPVVFYTNGPALATQPPNAALSTTVVYQPLPSVPTVPPVSSGSASPPATATCGISSGTTNRVVGGSEAKRGVYTWIAALGYRDEYDRNALKFMCAGSLITNTHVLTSAHCINPTLTLVRLGAHDLTNPWESQAVDFRIKRAVRHENFNLQSIANDIAVVELMTPAVASKTIGTICLPEASNFLSQDFVGMNPFIAGWGAVKHQGPTSNVLRDVQVPIVSRQVCEQSYRSIFKFVDFSDRLICAGNSNVDACQGDSGGPLMMPQMDASGTYRYYLLGIVSYGYECARTGFPGVYTRVASYVPWIKQQIMS